MRFHIQSRMDLAHTDQRPCSSCLPLLNPTVSHCHSSSQALPRQNHKVQNTQVSVSPLPQVLQSQPCSNRNGQQVGNTAGKASAPVGCPAAPAAAQAPGPRTTHGSLFLQSMAHGWPGCLIDADKVFCVRGSGCGDSTRIHMHYKKQALVWGQAGTKATFTHRRDIFLTKMNLNPDHSAASRTEKLRRNRQCRKCRGCDMGCAGLGYKVLSLGFQGVGSQAATLL